MSITISAAADPWSAEVVTVVGGSHSSAERRAISRDVQRGLLLRVGGGAYVERTAFEAMSPEDQHIVRMRALVAVSRRPVVFSHWSAAVLQGLPVLRSRLAVLHITGEDDDERPRPGVVVHLFGLSEADVVRFGELAATGVGRTVVDVAGGSPFEEGVMAADGALRAGVPRAMLEAAVALAGPRRAGRRIGEVVAFAHPGAESAAESRFRSTLMRLGIEVPILQHRVLLSDRSEAFLDGYLPRARVGIEVDGDAKYLDAQMAPEGAGRAVIEEKRREDEVRLGLRSLARIDWFQAGSMASLRGVLSRLGVTSTRPRTTLAAYCAAALTARPRFVQRRPRWRA